MVSGTNIWDELLEDLKEGKIDLVCAIAYTNQRKKIYLFNDETVFSNWGVVYTKKGNINSLFDLSGKTIAANSKDIHYENLKKLLDSFEIEANFLEFPTFEDVVSRLFGTLNAKKYRVKETTIIFSPVELRFAAPKNSSKSIELLSTIDKHLSKMKTNDGSAYYQIIDKYLSVTSKSPNYYILVLSILGLLAMLIVSLLIAFRIYSKFSQLRIRSRKRERKLLNMLDNFSDITFVLNRNCEFVEVFGRSGEYGVDAKSFIGKSIKDVFEKSETQHVEMVQRTFKGKEIVYEWEITLSDGSVRYFQTKLIPMLNEKGEVAEVFGINREITRLKEQQRKIENWLNFNLMLRKIILNVIADEKPKDITQVVHSVLNDLIETIPNAQFGGKRYGWKNLQTRGFKHRKTLEKPEKA